MSCKSIALTFAFLLLAALFLLGAGPTPAARPAPPQPPAPMDHDFFFSAGGARLGVQIADISSERARALGMKEEAGAEIKGVLPDSPAAAAGLKEGDVILDYQGTRIQGVAQLTRMVRETPAGRTVTLQVLRDRTPREVKVKVSEDEDMPMPGRHHIRVRHIEVPDIDVELPEFDLPEMVGPPFGPTLIRLGAQVEDLNEQLGAYFGVKGGEGVLVRSVGKGGPGDAAGLRAGDVIVRVDSEKVADHADLRSALRDRKDKAITLGVVRDRKETSLKIAVSRMPGRMNEDGDEADDDEDDAAVDRDSADHDAKQIRKEMKRIKTEIRKSIHEDSQSPDAEGETL